MIVGWFWGWTGQGGVVWVEVAEVVATLVVIAEGCERDELMV